MRKRERERDREREREKRDQVISTQECIHSTVDTSLGVYFQISAEYESNVIYLHLAKAIRVQLTPCHLVTKMNQQGEKERKKKEKNVKYGLEVLGKSEID